jgi:hypothetical protein
MPEKQEKQPKNDGSPARAAGAQPAARQRTAPGLHKRVLSAAHSLVRGVRSSKSASGSGISRNKSQRDRTTSSAPARKPRSQPGAVHPPHLSYPTTRRPASAARKAVRKVKSHIVEELEYCYQDDDPGFFFEQEEAQEEEEEAAPLFAAEKLSEKEKATDQLQLQPSHEKSIENPIEEPTKQDVMHDLNIDNDLREASVDDYPAVLKACLRRVAVHCNNLESHIRE